MRCDDWEVSTVIMRRRWLQTRNWRPSCLRREQRAVRQPHEAEQLRRRKLGAVVVVDVAHLTSKHIIKTRRQTHPTPKTRRRSRCRGCGALTSIVTIAASAAGPAGPPGGLVGTRTRKRDASRGFDRRPRGEQRVAVTKVTPPHGRTACSAHPTARSHSVQRTSAHRDPFVSHPIDDVLSSYLGHRPRRPLL